MNKDNDINIVCNFLKGIDNTIDTVTDNYEKLGFKSKEECREKMIEDIRNKLQKEMERRFRTRN